MYFIYFSRDGAGEVLLYLRDWRTPISVSYAAAFRTIGCVAQTTTRRRASAYVSGEWRVVRTT